MDIETAISGGKNELNVMMIMPFVVFLGLSGLGGSMTIVTNTFTNVVVKLVVLAIFVGAYVIGRKIMTIKI